MILSWVECKFVKQKFINKFKNWVIITPSMTLNLRCVLGLFVYNPTQIHEIVALHASFHDLACGCGGHLKLKPKFEPWDQDIESNAIFFFVFLKLL